MRKIILGILPLILAFLTFYFIKPSDEECRRVGIERLATINIKAEPKDILLKDYLILKTMRYAHPKDTFKLGSGFFLQVKVNDRKLEKIREGVGR
jgi:hypothetical protein